MRTTITIAALLAASVIAAGCGSTAGTSGPAPPASHPASTAPAAPQPSQSATAKSNAKSNARTLIEALASSSSFEMKQAATVVAGPVMIGYVMLQATEDEASEAEGYASRPERLTTTGPASYELCEGASGCQTMDQFTFDTTGRVTGMSVDGQPVEGRFGAGADTTSGGVTVTEVGSYRSTATGSIAVAFRLKNTSSHALAADGFTVAFITTTGARLMPITSQSYLDAGGFGTIPQGQSVPLIAVFNTRSVAGTLSVESVFSGALASVSLRMVHS